jgi:hypothetical protein
LKVNFLSQDETRNVTEYDTEKAAVTDAQENTANEQTKPRTKRLRLDSKIKGKNIKLLNKSLVYSLLSRHNFSGVRFVLCASSSFYVVPFGPSVYWIIHFD